MAIVSKVVDGTGKGFNAKVSKWGIQATGPIDFSVSYSVEAAVINTAYNFVAPVTNHQFVVTSILLYANKGVGAGDATVEIYEAEAIDTVTVDRAILTTEMLKNTSRDLLNINMIVSPGKWLNIKTDDNTIFATILGYYVPVA
jgi:hypothetical protein